MSRQNPSNSPGSTYFNYTNAECRKEYRAMDNLSPWLKDYLREELPVDLSAQGLEELYEDKFAPDKEKFKRFLMDFAIQILNDEPYMPTVAEFRAVRRRARRIAKVGRLTRREAAKRKFERSLPPVDLYAIYNTNRAFKMVAEAETKEQ